MVSRISHIFLAYSEQEHIQQYINIMQTCRENGTSWGIGYGLQRKGIENCLGT